jgi:antitoxin ChpS
MLAVPPTLLDLLGLHAGAKVGIAVQNGRLIVEPQKRVRYTLKELLGRGKRRAAQTQEEQTWFKGRAEGRELI